MRARGLLLAAGLLASVATSQSPETMSSGGSIGETGNLGCDDAPPALCVTAALGGEPVVPDSVEVQDAEHSVVLDMSEDECTWDLASGSYVVVATLGEETVAEPALVENSYACSHETTELELIFGAEE